MPSKIKKIIIPAAVVIVVIIAAVLIFGGSGVSKSSVKKEFKEYVEDEDHSYMFGADGDLKLDKFEYIADFTQGEGYYMYFGAIVEDEDGNKLYSIWTYTEAEDPDLDKYTGFNIWGMCDDKEDYKDEAKNLKKSVESDGMKDNRGNVID